MDRLLVSNEYHKIYVYIKTIILLLLVGDKSAHELTIHIPQLFYFSLFTIVFGPSLWIPQIYNFLKFTFNWKGIASTVILSALMALIIHHNTIVHPYLLADNRHYTFYIWNRFLGKHLIMRYLLIPLYIFGLFVICKTLSESVGRKIFFFVSIMLTICLQSLLEIRYFLIPFLLLRLHAKNVSKKWLILEFVFNLSINFVTFSIFFEKEIKWEDFEEPQRIIW